MHSILQNFGYIPGEFGKDIFFPTNFLPTKKMCEIFQKIEFYYLNNQYFSCLSLNIRRYFSIYYRYLSIYISMFFNMYFYIFMKIFAKRLVSNSLYYKNFEIKQLEIHIAFLLNVKIVDIKSQIYCSLVVENVFFFYKLELL